MYLPRHFKPTEYLPQSWIDQYDGMAPLAMDERILISIDSLRDFFGVPITINNYSKGLSYRGLRTPICPQYKPNSQHSFGRAIDFDVQGMDAENVRQTILKNQSKFPLISRMEIGTEWVHIDCANTGSSLITMVNP